LTKVGLRGSYRPPNLAGCNGLGEVWGPAGFVYDFESVPMVLRGPLNENKRGGTAHDIVCRIDAVPGITKSIAADVYLEIMAYCNSIDTQRFAKSKHPFIPAPIIIPVVKMDDWITREIKSNFVRYWPGKYFQVFKLDATSEEIYGISCDPYYSCAEAVKAGDTKLIISGDRRSEERMPK
jgi:hypothetical protein